MNSITTEHLEVESIEQPTIADTSLVQKECEGIDDPVVITEQIGDVQDKVKHEQRVQQQQQEQEITHEQKHEQQQEENDKATESDAETPQTAGKDTLESCSERIKQRTLYLQEQDAWDNAEVLKRLKNMSRVYWNHSKWRKSIGDCLAECNFAGISLKMLKYFNEVGVFKNDEVWFPTYYTYNVCWNYSDASLALAKDLAENGLIDILALNIGHEPYLQNQESKNVAYILKSSLSILQNLARVTEARPFFEKANIKQLLQPFLSSTNEFYKATATMILTAIIKEEENKMLEDTGAIPFLVKGVRFAISDKKNSTKAVLSKRRYRGFTPVELVQCLSRMAVNDTNKNKIVSEGCLPLLVAMMQYDDEEEQEAAARTVWMLSFAKDLLDTIRAEAGMLDTLEKLTQSSNSKVSKCASGALWELKNKAEHTGKSSKDEDHGGKKPKGHIFISYCWSDQGNVLPIKDRLKELGYKVWIDVECIKGSTLEAMALGIEDAAVVVICASEKYKISPNCRTEAEYTFQLKKPILPLMMQRYYKPDGWLGIMMGAKLYINFDGKYTFQKAMDMLVKELKEKLSVDVVDGPVKPSTAPLTTAAPPTWSHPPAATSTCTARSWGPEQLNTWRQDNKLDTDKWEAIFKEFDGKRLHQLQKMKNSAPEFYCTYLTKNLDLQLTDVLDLTEALDAVK